MSRRLHVWISEDPRLATLAIGNWTASFFDHHPVDVIRGLTDLRPPI